jgi:hypothetical protein
VRCGLCVCALLSHVRNLLTLTQNSPAQQLSGTGSTRQCRPPLPTAQEVLRRPRFAAGVHYCRCVCVFTAAPTNSLLDAHPPPPIGQCSASAACTCCVVQWCSLPEASRFLSSGEITRTRMLYQQLQAVLSVHGACIAACAAHLPLFASGNSYRRACCSSGNSSNVLKGRISEAPRPRSSRLSTAHGALVGRRSPSVCQVPGGSERCSRAPASAGTLPRGIYAPRALRIMLLLPRCLEIPLAD